VIKETQRDEKSERSNLEKTDKQRKDAVDAFNENFEDDLENENTDKSHPASFQPAPMTKLRNCDPDGKASE